jgi:opacity protein-like surface antigen
MALPLLEHLGSLPGTGVFTMRRLILAAAMLAAFAIPAGAQDGNSEVQGFGGMTFGTSTFFGTSISSTFGGRVAFGLLPNLQAIAEGGRMTEIRPPFLNLLDFTPADLRISAWYGEGGVRFITSPYSHVRPYGEATAGFARLSTGLSGIDYGRADTIVDAALAFVDRTEPMLGAGAGIVVQGGALTMDLGYRYNKILAGSGLASALNGGDAFSVNQVRIGVGFRF